MAPAPGKMCRVRLRLRTLELGKYFVYFSVCFRDMAMSPSEDIQNVIDFNNITSQMSLSGMEKQAGACEVVLRTPSMTCVKLMTYESVFTSKLKTMGSFIFKIKRSVLVRT